MAIEPSRARSFRITGAAVPDGDTIRFTPTIPDDGI